MTKAAAQNPRSFNINLFSLYTPTDARFNFVSAAWLLATQNTSTLLLLRAPTPAYAADMGLRTVCESVFQQQAHKKNIKPATVLTRCYFFQDIFF
jgi:hypothetical protein